LVRIGPLVIDLDDVRAIVDRGDPPGGGGPLVEVTFRDGSTMSFSGAHAEAIRRFVPMLPDCIPMVGGPNDAAMGVVGRRDEFAPVQRENG
jgi:hypothetical protein